MSRLSKFKGKKVLGIQIHTQGMSSYWAYTLLELEGKGVKIIKQDFFEEAFSFDAFFEQKFNKRLPLILNFTGTNILIEDEGNTLFAGQELFSRIYSYKSKEYIASIYKKQLDEYIGILYEKSYFVWKVELSSFPVVTISSLISSKEIDYPDLSLSHEVVQVKSTLSTCNLSALKISCTIGEETTNKMQLPSLASGLSFYGDEEVEYPLLASIQKEFAAYRLSVLLAYSTLAFLFVALVVNMFFFQKYNADYASIQAQVLFGQEQKKQIEELTKAIDLKQSILRNVVAEHPIPLSYLADQLAICVPENMRLTNLQIDPVEGKIRKRKDLVFRANLIRLEGICDYPDDFSLFLNKIVELKWINKIARKEYKNTLEGGTFMIEIYYGNK